MGISDFGPIGIFDRHIKSYLSAKFQPDSPKDLFPYSVRNPLIGHKDQSSQISEKKDTKRLKIEDEKVNDSCLFPDKYSTNK